LRLTLLVSFSSFSKRPDRTDSNRTSCARSVAKRGDTLTSQPASAEPRSSDPVRYLREPDSRYPEGLPIGQQSSWKFGDFPRIFRCIFRGIFRDGQYIRAWSGLLEHVVSGFGQERSVATAHAASASVSARRPGDRPASFTPSFVVNAATTEASARASASELRMDGGGQFYVADFSSFNRSGGRSSLGSNSTYPAASRGANFLSARSSLGRRKSTGGRPACHGVDFPWPWH
jgi:hypothetical protein